MAVISTKAIVLSVIKYGDTSLIVKCFTQQEGLKTYLIRGVLSAKKTPLKAGYFQVLTQLNIIANHNTKGNLNSIKEAHILHPYTTIYTNIIKQSMVLFLSEVLSFCIQEEENNDLLYEYLENSLIWLDTHGKIANFHLLFLLNLTQFLGFYPDVSKKNTLAFDLLEGNFTDAVNGKDVVSGNDFYQFKKLLNLNFNEIEQVSFGKAERQKVLQLILKFYSLHLDGFRNPKSLAIFETVFR